MKKYYKVERKPNVTATVKSKQYLYFMLSNNKQTIYYCKTAPRNITVQYALYA